MSPGEDSEAVRSEQARWRDWQLKQKGERRAARKRKGERSGSRGREWSCERPLDSVTVLQHQARCLVYPPKKNTGSATRSHKPSLQSTADYCLLWHSRIRATSLSARTLNTPHHTLDPLQRWRPENQPIPPGHGNMPLAIGCGSPSSAGSGPENILSHGVLYASIAAVATGRGYPS